MNSQKISFKYLAISNQQVCPEPVPVRINRLFELGVPAIQLREKNTGDRKKLRWLRETDKPKPRTLLVNSRPDLTKLSEADGIHRAQTAISSKKCQKIAGEDVLIGLSTHTPTEAHNAGRLDVDYITFGPIFPTPSKPNLSAEECPGLEELKKITEKVDLPVFALGGVGPERVSDCLEAGAHGVAGIRALFQPEDPAENWVKINEQLT